MQSTIRMQYFVLESPCTVKFRAAIDGLLFDTVHW